MLFNSLEFAVFLPITFTLYWLLKDRLRLQNLLLLLASYLFYGWWDYRFLGLIVLSSITDYLIGIGLSHAERPGRKTRLLGLSLLVNLGLLGFFKYYNFFVESFIEAFASIGLELNPYTLKIILPVGISFYTFQTLSYTIDVYRGKIPATKQWLDFFAYVSFFPQLVAGPIERAANLLPQFARKRVFDYELAADGMRQILWGLFKKIVIADNCAIAVNAIFENYGTASGSELVLGAVFFAFQIYGDFSGYSDIAIGTAKLFGFELMINFRTPYFARDIAEFWRRWHISLSTWFRDYLYIPLGGSRGTLRIQIRNVMIIFVVSGFWHGANWTFIIWGFLNALYFLPLFLLNRNRRHLDTVAEGRLLPSLAECFHMGLTFGLTCLAWVFFRAPTVSDAFQYLSGIVDPSLLSSPAYKSYLPYVALLVLVEWFQREKEHGLQVNTYARYWRVGFYYALFGLILFFGNFGENSFIYFQF